MGCRWHMTRGPCWPRQKLLGGSPPSQGLARDIEEGGGGIFLYPNPKLMASLSTQRPRSNRVQGGVGSPPAKNNPNHSLLDSTHLTQKAFAFVESLSEVLTFICKELILKYIARIISTLL